MSFNPAEIDLTILKERAFNLRWAEVPQDVIPLTAADPDFKCAPEIIHSLNSYIGDRYFSYAPAEGLSEFKIAMATYLKFKRNVDIDPTNILPVDSAAFGIYVTCKSILNTGDEAIIFDPVDFLFQYSIENNGGKAVRFSIPPGTNHVDFKELEKLITSKTKLICLCNPLNPTGKVFSKEELQELGEIAVRHNIVILSDEIWSDIVFSPYEFTSICSLSPEIANHVVYVNGFSKSYGLAGLRIGVVATLNSDLFAKIVSASLHHSTIHGANVLGQIAATAALNLAQDWLQGFLIHLEKMRNLLTDRINQMKGLHTIAPQGCYVSLINIKETGLSSMEFHEKMLKEAKVSVVPGLSKWFGPGADGYVRISFATSEEVLSEALDRIENNL